MIAMVAIMLVLTAIYIYVTPWTYSGEPIRVTNPYHRVGWQPFGASATNDTGLGEMPVCSDKG